MADVFVSYAAEDRDRVKPIVAAIENQGLTVWWDRQIGIGSSFDREIERELDSASAVVLVWSKNSIESDWVRNEAQEGFDRGVLVPVVVDDVRQPLAFRRMQAAHLDDDGLVEMLQAVALLSGRTRETATTARNVTSDSGEFPAEGRGTLLRAIAVMPFDDLSPEGDQAWLAEGMAEELIDSLSRINELRIPARNSTSSTAFIIALLLEKLYTHTTQKWV